MKLSIKDYSTLKSISLQAVYQSCIKQRIKCIEENGQKYVIVGIEELKTVDKAVVKPDTNSSIKQLLKQLNKKDKEIKRLTKQLIKCAGSKEKMMLDYVSEMKRLYLPPAAKKESAINAEIVSKKKKKKKKK